MQKKIASSKNIKGKAKVVFTVNPKGKVSDIKIVEKDNDAVAKGAVMIATKMPGWTPGKQRGKAVPVKFMMPVEFK
jgi:TonB family protein